MPMRLDDGWNQIQFNLSDFTRRAYGTNYIETLRVQVSSKFVSLMPFANPSLRLHGIVVAFLSPSLQDVGTYTVSLVQF